MVEGQATRAPGMEVQGRTRTREQGREEGEGGGREERGCRTRAAQKTADGHNCDALD